MCVTVYEIIQWKRRINTRQTVDDLEVRSHIKSYKRHLLIINIQHFNVKQHRKCYQGHKDYITDIKKLIYHHDFIKKKSPLAPPK